MKYPSKNWPEFKVRFWTHRHDQPGKPLNDCFGNSMERTIKARNEDEAKKLAAKRFDALRFHSVAKTTDIERYALVTGTKDEPQASPTKAFGCEYTNAQLLAWIERNNWPSENQLSARVAIEDARTLHLS